MSVPNSHLVPPAGWTLSLTIAAVPSLQPLPVWTLSSGACPSLLVLRQSLLL